MIELLLILFTAISIWDIHTTSNGLKHGYAKEATPWLRWINKLHEDAAFWFLVILKIVVVVALWTTASDDLLLLYIGLIVLYGYFVAIGNTKLWYAYHFKSQEKQ
jgi:hypothetical protein